MDEGPDKQHDRRGGGPVALASLVAAVTRPMMRGRQATVARLALDWPQVVGPALAAVTAPERLAG
uniref:DciA family protein n=1 Tax=Elioraea rosea TaxID=2492390 RepID=UPI00118606C7